MARPYNRRMSWLGGRTLVALDASGLTGAGLGRGFRRGEVGASVRVPLEPGALVPDPVETGLRDPAVVKAALADLLDRLGRHPRATLVLPMGLARFALLDPPPAPKAREFARFRLGPSLPFAAEEAIIDVVPAGRRACSPRPSVAKWSRPTRIWPPPAASPSSASISCPWVLGPRARASLASGPRRDPGRCGLCRLPPRSGRGRAPFTCAGAIPVPATTAVSRVPSPSWPRTTVAHRVPECSCWAKAAARWRRVFGPWAGLRRPGPRWRFSEPRRELRPPTSGRAPEPRRRPSPRASRSRPRRWASSSPSYGAVRATLARDERTRAGGTRSPRRGAAPGAAPRPGTGGSPRCQLAAPGRAHLVVGPPPRHRRPGRRCCRWTRASGVSTSATGTSSSSISASRRARLRPTTVSSRPSPPRAGSTGSCPGRRPARARSRPR